MPTSNQNKSPALSVKNVGKTYRTRTPAEGVVQSLSQVFNPKYSEQKALSAMSFDLAVGECLGFLGPNGAGKSTLTKILCGLQAPTSGRVEVLGYQPFNKQPDFLRSIGAVFGHKNSLWWDLPLQESFKTTKKIYGIDDDRYEANLAELTTALNLSELMHKPVRVLSLGERVKSELAMNLLHDPKVLFLDEPTVGLDVSSKVELRQYLRHCTRAKGVSIFLTSHDMGDVEACCDRVLLVNAGEIEYAGTVDKLKTEISHTLQIAVTGTDKPLSSAEQQLLGEFAQEQAGVELLAMGTDEVRYRCQQGVRGVAMREIFSRCPNVTAETIQPTLEELLSAYFGREN